MSVLFFTEYKKRVLITIKIILFLLVFISLLIFFIPQILMSIQGIIDSEYKTKVQPLEVELPHPNLLDGFAVLLRYSRGI